MFLTILEYKGLEFQVVTKSSYLIYFYYVSYVCFDGLMCLFQDILLYKFFGSSPLKGRWRVIYEYIIEQGMLESTEYKSYPSFNDSKHYILCFELKQLYVAITRTRQRLWICENNNRFSKPMFDYWKKRCLV